MYSINIGESITSTPYLMPLDQLLPHEEVVTDRLNTLISYLTTLKPYIIIPSILVCDKTNMIVDGHHRYYALKEMGFEKVPVTPLNYSSKLIVTDLEGKVTKKELLESAQKKIMYKPKSSFHHVLDTDLHFQPIILLSVLFRLDHL
jgi:hypothetical protein